MLLAKDECKASSCHLPITSRESREDAYGLAENLGIAITELPIQGIMRVMLRCWLLTFEGKEKRYHGREPAGTHTRNLLMAFSNKFGWLVAHNGQ